MKNVKAIYNDSMVGTYEEELTKFPYAYQEKIKKLHNTYPNAIFVAQDKFFDWNKYKEVEVNWNSMLDAQLKNKRSEIEASAPDNYKSSICGETSGNKCTWYIASKEAVEYYMNPYNFLDEKHVFMFESQYYKDYHIKEGVEKILSGTFMANTKCEGSDKTYSEVILEAAVKYNISPYMLAARLKQEQGSKGTSALISGEYEGYENFYNYFNIQAGGSTDEIKITNGLKCANGTLTNSKGQKLCEGNNWNSPYSSIIGGAKFIYKEYIGINDTYNVKGQMTNYLQKWDPYGPVFGGHQYMQNIRAPYYESESTFKSYSSFKEYKNYNYVFYIPIYKDAPNLNDGTNTDDNTTSDNIKKLITYNISDNYISGIQEKTLQADFIKNITDKLKNSTVSITKNNNNKTENIATGDIIKIKYNEKEFTYTAVIYGDLNGDSIINSADLLKIRQHLIPTNELKGAYLISANLNRNDTIVNSADLLKMRQHLIGLAKINQ
ncbi:MAG: hypothetical protein J6K21_01295 [Bacilli bacterium]|nr:hypothetical protein [Bacilli bacterium]